MIIVPVRGENSMNPGGTDEEFAAVKAKLIDG